MKKTFALVSIVLSASLLLASCGGNINSSGKAGAQGDSMMLLPKEDKMAAVKDLIKVGEKDSMTKVDAYFADLMFVKKVVANDDASVSQKGDESWMYSINDDATVVVDITNNAPVAIFAGKAISKEELAGFRK